MRVDCEITLDKIVIIRPHGDFTNIDDTSNLDLWITMMRNMEVQRIIYDLQPVGELNSVAIGLLLNLHTYLGKHNGRLILANLNAKIKEMFKVSGFSSVFETHDSVASALTALRS